MADEAELLRIARARRKSELSHARERDFANGAWVRALPLLLSEAQVIPAARLDALARFQHAADLEGQLAVHELMALAVKWGVCASAADFWRGHKG